MDDRMFRDAMGRFATGVTVITTEVEGNTYAMTANAFMSVSLNPKLVVISIGERANIKEQISKSGTFAVSILAEDQEEMSSYFAGQIKEKRDVQFKTFNDMPVIEGALVNLTCKVHDAHVAGDHTLYIGEVTDLHLQDGQPLAFFQGKYKKLV